MAVVDIKKKLIKGKIVYYGPGLCGKTTNLEYVNRAVKGSPEMMSLATEGDRTIFFDYLPMELGKIRGIETTFKLYTVPGQVRYNLTRKMVLKNVDGIVFVADSQPQMIDANVDSLKNLLDNMDKLKIKSDDVPLVLQYNKRDLPNVVDPTVLDETLNKKGYPVYLSSAVTGEGVLETLREISKLVFLKLSSVFGEPTQTLTKPPKKSTKKKTAPYPLPKPEPPPVPVSMEKKEPKTGTADKDKKPKEVPLAKVQKDKPTAQITRDTADNLVTKMGEKLLKTIEENNKKTMELVFEYVSKEIKKIENNISKQLVDGSLATKADLDKLAKSLENLAKTKIDTKAGTDAKGLSRDTLRSLEKTTGNLATRKDIENLQKTLSGLGGKPQARAQSDVDLREFRKEITRIIEQKTRGLATKKDFEAVSRAVDKLTRSTNNLHPGLSLEEFKKESNQIVDKITDGIESKLGGFQRPVSPSLSKLSESIRKRRGADSRPTPDKTDSVEETTDQNAQQVEEKTIPDKTEEAAKKTETIAKEKSAPTKTDETAEQPDAKAEEKQTTPKTDKTAEQPEAKTETKVYTFLFGRMINAEIFHENFLGEVMVSDNQEIFFLKSCISGIFHY